MMSLLGLAYFELQALKFFFTLENLWAQRYALVFGGTGIVVACQQEGFFQHLSLMTQVIELRGV